MKFSQVSLIWAWLLIYLTPTIWAVETKGKAEDESTPSEPTSTENATDPGEKEHLPDIEAKSYGVKVVRRSQSNKVYLFEDITDQQPATGRILLIKKDDEPYMAFRILKYYSDKRLIAAKKIKRYGKHKKLDKDESFIAIEKISDISPPAPTLQDKEDLHELETQEKLKPVAFDPELDTTTSQEPPREGEPEEETSIPKQQDLEENSHLAVTIEESQKIDNYRHWLTFGFGYIRNNGSPTTGGSFYFSSGNLRYGISIGQNVFLDRPHLQDSIALETGVYLYKALNFATSGDAYTVMSVPFTLRYNLAFSESFAMFIYGGVTVGYVITSSQGTADAVTALTSLLPAGGGGFLFQVGPNWYTRADLGLDTIALNLVLRF